MSQYDTRRSRYKDANGVVHYGDYIAYKKYNLKHYTLCKASQWGPASEDAEVTCLECLALAEGPDPFAPYKEFSGDRKE